MYFIAFIFLVSSVTSLLATEISKLGSHHANQIIRAETSDQTNYSTDIYYEVFYKNTVVKVL